MATYDRGDCLRLTATFTDIAGAAKDPTVIKFKYKTPGGGITTLIYGTDAAVVKSGTGIYYVDLPLDSAGVWDYRWEGTGAVVAADEDPVTVRQGEF